MKKSLFAAMILALGVVACGKKQEAAPAPAPAAEQKPADAAPAAPAAAPAAPAAPAKK